MSSAARARRSRTRLLTLAKRAAGRRVHVAVQQARLAVLLAELAGEMADAAEALVELAAVEDVRRD